MRCLVPLLIASTVSAEPVDAVSRLTIGGYTQFDGRFFLDDSADPHTDQFSFRSIRPELKGTLLDHYDFRLLPDFAQGKTVIQDAYVDVRYSELVKVRFGKLKVPFGLERIQKEVATTFVERGLPSLLTPNRDLGVLVFGDIGPVEYEAGVFDGVADNGSSDGDVSDHKTGLARVFVHPSEGLGIGAAGTYGWEQGTMTTPLLPTDTTQGGTTFFAFPDGTLSSGRHWRASGQAYYYRGPLGLIGEYVRSVQHVTLAGSNERAVSDAWQGVAQWVITGEHASYNSVTPAHSYGAFDVAMRFGELRLPNRDRARSLGAGFDWFVNNQIRAVLDLEHTWYWLGRPAETSVIGRVQTVF